MGTAAPKRDSKHLDFLKDAIARMATHSFAAKGWSITLGSAALALAVKDGADLLALIGLVPVLLFWSLDAYYLALERSFVALFEAAAKLYRDDTPPTFDMKAKVGGPRKLLGAAFSPAVWPVHGAMVVALVATYCTVAS